MLAIRWRAKMPASLLETSRKKPERISPRRSSGLHKKISRQWRIWPTWLTRTLSDLVSQWASSARSSALLASDRNGSLAIALVSSSTVFNRAPGRTSLNTRQDWSKRISIRLRTCSTWLMETTRSLASQLDSSARFSATSAKEKPWCIAFNSQQTTNESTANRIPRLKASLCPMFLTDLSYAEMSALTFLSLVYRVG